MNTKQKIIEQSLILFAEKGYEAVTVANIADAVGIKAPSLYKHFKSKQDIFDSILVELKLRYEAQAGMLNIGGMDANKDVASYMNISAKLLGEMVKGLFAFFLHDDYTARFRKMMTIEQYKNNDIATLYSRQYFDDVICYQEMLFANLMEQGIIKKADAKTVAFQFFTPILSLIALCDRQPEREEEAYQYLEAHVNQFNALYANQDVSIHEKE